MKIKNFSKSKVSLPLPYLLNLQKQSWDWFLKQGLKEIFSEVSPIRDYTKKELELWFEDYKLDEPKYKTDLEAKKNNDSFEASLRVRTKLVNLKTKEIKEQEIFLTDLPLMTERGTFVVNGVERVAIGQLIRSPGVFFTKSNYGFGAKVIPNRGAWLEFETENTGALMVKIDRKRKIAATVLLRAFLNLDTERIKKEFQDIIKNSEIDYIEETLKKDTCNNPGEALVEIYKRLRPGDLVTPETAKELIDNTFFNFERYDLSRVGRWKMRKKIKELATKDDNKIEKQDRVLCPQDILLIIKEILKKNINPKAKPDEIDHLGNRRVRTLAEFLQNRLRVGLMRMERNIKDKMSTLDTDMIVPAQLINSRPVMSVIKEFFTSSQICQFMDNVNPLSELEHKRRLSATGPGGLTRERAGFEVRDVQPSHYGRICPIQTPEGPNIGLINQLACFARLNEYGFIETPYFKVEKGKITSKIHYLSAFEEENYNIVHAGIEIDNKGLIVNKKVEARIKGEPGLMEKEKIDFIDVSTEQSISMATSLIPFLQNDDANRALMGSNMQRQSVPLVKPDVPLVGTGVEEKIAKDSGQIILAEQSGNVSYVDADCIKINNKEYKLNTFLKTNQYTCFHQKPIVKKGDKVQKGEALTDGGSISNGKLALGQNVLVAFLSWEGCSFEDSIVLSERLVKNDIFSSMHIETFICDVRDTKLGPEMTTCDIPNVSEEKLKDLDEEGIIRIGAEVKQNDILVGKISPKGEATLTAEERLLRAIFGEKAKDVKDTSLLMEHGKQGRVIGVKIFSRDQGHKLEPGVIKRIEVEIAQLRKIQAGDKLAGRHGNKGVVGKIVPEEEMPYLEDGTPVDILLNPLSVASRMNIGQILETHLGMAAKKLNYISVTPSLSGADEFNINEELEKAGLPKDGKITLFNGKTGIPFPEKITVGYIYMMKLIHMVKDKLHMRSIGPYSLITQQPLGGKAQFGGQRFGEMEVWALEGYGAAHALQEILTIKSDDVQGRVSTYEAILKGEKIKSPNIPASFNLLVNELKSLGFSIEVKEKPKEIK
ncbi:MAG: DNA-directed RNA polymerase subunit beta [Candidatus Pacebacteria bacterium]|nr:DNA-directed RNA polymerase subunit beta [Candidatus Paceibacterota bacterium]